MECIDGVSLGIRLLSGKKKYYIEVLGKKYYPFIDFEPTYDYPSSSGIDRTKRKLVFLVDDIKQPIEFKIARSTEPKSYEDMKRKVQEIEAKRKQDKALLEVSI